MGAPTDGTRSFGIYYGARKMTPLVTSLKVVSFPYFPVLAVEATVGSDPFSILMQVPILAILVFVVWMFLRHMKESEKVRIELHSKSNEELAHSLKLVHAAMQEDAEMKGRMVTVVERLEKKLDGI